ncbi:MAG: arginine--tRNA ligase [Candidatus Pacearchaeota archaeon]
MLKQIVGIVNSFGLSLEVPAFEFGDLSIPIFRLDKEKIEKLKEKLRKIEGIEKIEEVGGFVNLTIKNDQKLKFIEENIKGKGDKGKEKKEKILIEHTSINPNASPHIGRARNAIIGDCLARLLTFCGYDVERHYYVNDIGKQIAMLALLCKGNEKFADLLKIYQMAAEKIEKDKEFEKEVFKILEKIEAGNWQVLKKIKKIVKNAVTGQKAILEKIGVTFDYFDYESDFLNRAKQLVDEIYKKGLGMKDSEGKIVFDLRGSGLEKGMKEPFVALTRPNGTTLYLTRDLAYTIWKISRASKNIIVLGEDQKLYFSELSFILRKLGYEPPRAIHYSMVLLQSAEGISKMSTRAGTLILLDEFFNELTKKLKEESEKRKARLSKKQIEMLASNIIRYTIARIDYNKNVLFDIARAIKLEGDTAVYLNYTLARALSILKKLKLKKKPKKIKLDSLEEKEARLLHALFAFPFTLEKAKEGLNIVLIAHYLYSLCRTFNDFYENCSIIKAKKDEKTRRIALLLLSIEIIKSCFKILGLHGLERI